MARPLVLAALLCAPASAGAFCGFFVAGSGASLKNSASQVAIVRAGNHTVMTLSNNYQGPPEDFAMVVPVPVVLGKDDVKTLSHDIFDKLDRLTAPRLVEYWEQDPCPRYGTIGTIGRGGGRGIGSGYGAGADRLKSRDLGVTVEARFEQGEYQIVILSAKDSSGLETWLHQNRYKIPDGAAAALAPYVRQQMKFFVAKVDIKKVKRDEAGRVVLSPLRFGYDAEELRLPVRLGLLNAGKQKQDLIVYLLGHNTRYEVANYPNVFIPTNLEVADEVRTQFPAFYAQLFDATLAQHQNRAVITEYAWMTRNCDPCPTPPLRPMELQYLGADFRRPPDVAPARPYSPQLWVVTRLHTRYDRQTLDEDLIFRAAAPVVGGRATSAGAQAESEVKPAAANAFQARYIIRHYWTGPATCESPAWGRWGGPPSGQPSVTPARGLAHAPRDRVSLEKVVFTGVPGLGLAGHPRPERKP